MPYTYHTDEDRRGMLDVLGFASEDVLFDRIPEKYRLRELLAMDAGRTEPGVVRMFSELADRNHAAGATLSFLGGGIYDHVVPSVVKNLASRPEFATAYTPYQPEVSQGTLQVIFEFQTHISRLTALPIANASMYDAASAVAEAALMSAKITGRSTVIVPASLHPRYRRVVERYLEGQNIALRTVAMSDGGDIAARALRAALDDTVAGVIVQTPNYFGIIERPWDYEADIHSAGALLVACVDPIALSALRPPGSYQADIAVGEGQSLGNDMNFGGPLLGFMACRQEHIRQMPGRIVSATTDVDGRDGFVLTLQTREQHIRREKATSNICTNQGLLATRATIYLSLLGERGLVELGRICHNGARALADRIVALDGYSLPYAAPFFREFVVRCPVDADRIVAAARTQGVMAGIPLARYFGDASRRDLLMSVTEKHDTADFERMTSILKSAR